MNHVNNDENNGTVASNHSNVSPVLHLNCQLTMTYTISTDEEIPLDADFDLLESTIILHSRGGAKGKGARNSDYAAALRLVLERLNAEGINVRAAWVDSSHVQDLPFKARRIFLPEDRDATPEQMYSRMTSRMAKIGHVSGVGKGGGNRTKRIRIRLLTRLAVPDLARVIGASENHDDAKRNKRLPAELLNSVSADHVWSAVQKFMKGYKDNRYGPSSEYDLIADDGSRLPPKAVFGLAATEALGFDVLPEHFSAGDGGPCYRLLRNAGYAIVPKGDLGLISEKSSPPVDEEWTEGQPKLVSHVKKERGRGLSAAKKALFKRLEGKLFCERCKLDPVAYYKTEDAEACIEVHHRATQVKDMREGHTTRLEDLQCLCANCHRLVHKQLKRRLLMDSGQLTEG